MEEKEKRIADISVRKDEWRNYKEVGEMIPQEDYKRIVKAEVVKSVIKIRCKYCESGFMQATESNIYLNTNIMLLPIEQGPSYAMHFCSLCGASEPLVRFYPYIENTSKKEDNV